MLAISGCLGGVCCRYDGSSNAVGQLQQLADEGRAVMICPEVIGGLPTPRAPAEIIGGDGFDVWRGQAQVLTNTKEDVTEAFKRGAVQAYEQIKDLAIDCVVLKANSPSCGSHLIYDGTFSGKKISGVGVATAYFMQQGLTVLTETEWLAQQVDS